jgi:hypothetical protein
LIIQNSKFKTQNQLYCQNLSTSQVHHSQLTTHNFVIVAYEPCTKNIQDNAGLRE